MTSSPLPDHNQLDLHNLHLLHTDRVDEEDEDQDNVEYDSDDSDRKSKMSFSYWGADKITVQNPGIPVTTEKSNAVKANKKLSDTGLRGGRRVKPIGRVTYGRESAANAKFGTRLITEDSPARAAALAAAGGSVRPTSRRHGGQQPPSQGNKSHTSSKKIYNEDSSTSRATVTPTNRPAWDKSTRVTSATTTTSRTVRSRVNSQSTLTQNTASSTVAGSSSGKVASIAPSEDSGVGMYQQMMAQNPSFDRESR